MSFAKYISIHFFPYVAIQTFVRLLLFLSSLSMMSLAPLDLGGTFFLGFADDAAVGLLFTMPIVFFFIMLPPSCRNSRYGRRILAATAFILNFITIFTAVALFFFWQEFNTSFNFIAVDYLIYTTELLGNIWQSYPVEWLLPVILGAAWCLTGYQLRRCPYEADISPRQRTGSLLAFPLILALLFAWPTSLREGVSASRYNVELAGNAMHDFAIAFTTNEIDYQTFYLLRDEKRVLDELRRKLQSPNSAYASEDGIRRHVENVNELTGKWPNIVIITVESLNASYCGAFGAEVSWTPELDKLATQSFIFTKMLSTGTRTVRGLEALSLSVPPTPGQSILRRRDNADMATLGAVLKEAGYETDFIYGGYGYFDNMNNFFAANDYTVKDRLSFPEEEIFQETIWGVADEILFTQVLKSLDEHHSDGQKALEMVMTTTNHRPFTFPEGRVDAPQSTREGACRYTDWAIADFLRRAADKPWFDDTVFVIVADHQARAAGKTTLPVNTYHIPCLVYAPKLIAPGECDRLISQMDLPPTILGMLGISYDSQFMGQDINCVPAGEERAFISTYQLLGYIKNDYLVTLSPGRQYSILHIDDWEDASYSPATPDADSPLLEEAVCWYQGASLLYLNGGLKRRK